MTNDALDPTPLRNALARLNEGWERYQKDTTDTQIRDGLIQRFEFTYEISHKMLKRYLKATSANAAEFDEKMGFQDHPHRASTRPAFTWLAAVARLPRDAGQDQPHLRGGCGAGSRSRHPGLSARSGLLAAAAKAGKWEGMTTADTTPPPIDNAPQHWQIVRQILRQHVPQHPVWAFGSRARRAARPLSDLDLAITDRPLSVHAALTEAFSESDLPYKVDIVD